MRRWLRKAALLLPVVFLTVTGCGEPSTNFAFQEVRYTLTGGVAGFDRALRIRANGSYQVIEEGRTLRTGQLAGAELRQLKELLAAVDWLDLQPDYSDPKVADAIHETLVLRTASQEQEVRAGTGGSPPPALSTLLRFLADKLRERYRA